jgi:hypothetical protein
MRSDGGLSSHSSPSLCGESTEVGRGNPCPPNLPGAASSYLTPAAVIILLEWAEHAKMATEVRHAAIRDTYQARYQNVKHFRRLLLRSACGGTLDQNTLRAALGERQPKQRMWGISGQAVLLCNLT